MPLRKLVITSLVFSIASPSANAATASGYVIRVEGRADNTCRYVIVRKADGNNVLLRIPTGAGSEGIMATALTAIATRMPVEVDYSTASICGGTELSINSLGVTL